LDGEVPLLPELIMFIPVEQDGANKIMIIRITRLQDSGEIIITEEMIHLKIVILVIEIQVVSEDVEEAEEEAAMTLLDKVGVEENVISVIKKVTWLENVLIKKQVIMIEVIEEEVEEIKLVSNVIKKVIWPESAQTTKARMRIEVEAEAVEIIRVVEENAISVIKKVIWLENVQIQGPLVKEEVIKDREEKMEVHKEEIIMMTIIMMLTPTIMLDGEVVINPIKIITKQRMMHGMSNQIITMIIRVRAIGERQFN
jgi:hypothetical protein